MLVPNVFEAKHMNAISAKTAIALLTLVATQILSMPVQAATIKGIAEQCAEKKQICFWHKAVVTPPKGWIEDPQWTLRYKAMTMFENGDQSESKPLMYLRTHAGEKELSLDEYVRVAQERWTKRVPDSKIEPLADFVRPGKPVIKVFLYKNPSVENQEFELTAFMKDVDSAHPDQTYFFQAVVVSSSREEIEKAKKSFYELLGNM